MSISRFVVAALLALLLSACSQPASPSASPFSDEAIAALAATASRYGETGAIRSGVYRLEVASGAHHTVDPRSRRLIFGSVTDHSGFDTLSVHIPSDHDDPIRVNVYDAESQGLAAFAVTSDISTAAVDSQGLGAATRAFTYIGSALLKLQNWFRTVGRPKLIEWGPDLACAYAVQSLERHQGSSLPLWLEAIACHEVTHEIRRR